MANDATEEQAIRRLADELFVTTTRKTGPIQYLRLLSTTGLCLALGACTEPTACTLSFAAVAATVIDSVGQPLSDVTVIDTVRRTGAVLHVTDNFPSMSPGQVIIFSDAFVQAVGPIGDEVIVVVTSGGQ